MLGLNFNSDDLSGGVRVSLEVVEEIDVEQLLLAGEAGQQGRRVCEGFHGAQQRAPVFRQARLARLTNPGQWQSRGILKGGSTHLCPALLEMVRQVMNMPWSSVWRLSGSSRLMLML